MVIMRKTDKDDDSVMDLDNLTEAFLEAFCSHFHSVIIRKTEKGDNSI